MKYRAFMTAIDYRSVVENKEKIKQEVKLRKANCDVDLIVGTYAALCELNRRYGKLKADQNRASKLAFSGKDHDVEAGQDPNVLKIRDEVRSLGKDVRDMQDRLFVLSKGLPNRIHPDVPRGSEPRVVEVVGDPHSRQSNLGKHRLGYMDMISRHNLADFKAGGKVAGSGFYYMKGAGALLEQALISYAIRRCREAGFTFTIPPAAVRVPIMEACGFNPRSEESHVYEVMPSHVRKGDTPKRQSSPQTEENEDMARLVLVATSEYPLCAAFSSSTLMKTELPIKISGLSPCFRAEGLAGATNRGLYRVHQFNKVEMVVITTEDMSASFLETLVGVQKDIFSGLGLCYRVIEVGSEDLGAPAYRKFDLEAWLPSRNSWGEITSASNCTDYQARRLNIRCYSNNEDGKHTSYLHTLNATACAIPRTIIAILEQLQDENRDVSIPAALSPTLEYLTSSNRPISKLSQLCSYVT